MAASNNNEDEQFSLCWNNFSANLSGGFHEALLNEELTDVTLSAGGKFVKAHRLVLSVCSPYFRDLFQQVPQNQHAMVFLKDVKYNALKDLITFMYRGEVNVKQEALPGFIATAEALQVKGLTDNDPTQTQVLEETIAPPTPQPAPIVQIPIPTQRAARPKNTSSSRYKIENVEQEDSRSQQQAPVIIHQAAAVATTPVQTVPTIINHQQQQPSTSSAAAAASSGTNKRTAGRIGGASSKRAKTHIDPLESGADIKSSLVTTVSATAQKQLQALSAASASASNNESKVQHIRQHHVSTSSESEYVIPASMDLHTKSEPDYTDDGQDVATDAEVSYQEDDTYMPYDESYLVDSEDAAPPASNNSGTVATTSKNAAKLEQSYVDASFGEGGDHGGGDAQVAAKVPKKRGRPKLNKSEDGGRVKLIDRLLAATQDEEKQQIVYASTTKGGMRLVFDGHHFKFSFRKAKYSVFQCCYKEGREECRVRVVCDQQHVYPLDGEHSHYMHATDKSVTSEFVPGAGNDVPPPEVEDEVVASAQEEYVISDTELQEEVTQLMRDGEGDTNPNEERRIELVFEEQHSEPADDKEQPVVDVKVESPAKAVKPVTANTEAADAVSSNEMKRFRENIVERLKKRLEKRKS